MAKKTATNGSAGPSKSAASSSKKAENSIDDIFAKPSKAILAAGPSEPKVKKDKGKSKALPPSTSAAGPSLEEGAPPKKKKKARQIASFDPDTAPPAKSRIVETVMDPSLAAISAQVASAKASSTQDGAKRKRSTKDTEEDEVFRDSRGTGPRRQTEEGYNIYKEAELKINPEAGGTPLCPFDCDCCF